MNDRLQVPLEEADSLEEGEMRLYQAGAFEVLLCRVQGDLHAIENRCSHQAQPLVRGKLRNHLLVCPVHGAAFDVRDGTHKSPPATCGIETFPVICRAGRVLVEVPKHAKRPAIDPFSGPQVMRTR